VRRVVVEVEALEFHPIWVGDHLFHPVDVYHPMLGVVSDRTLGAEAWIVKLNSVMASCSRLSTSR